MIDLTYEKEIPEAIRRKYLNPALSPPTAAETSPLAENDKIQPMNSSVPESGDTPAQNPSSNPERTPGYIGSNVLQHNVLYCSHLRNPLFFKPVI